MLPKSWVSFILVTSLLGRKIQHWVIIFSFPWCKQPHHGHFEINVRSTLRSMWNQPAGEISENLISGSPKFVWTGSDVPMRRESSQPSHICSKIPQFCMSNTTPGCEPCSYFIGSAGASSCVLSCWVVSHSLWPHGLYSLPGSSSP